MKLLLDECVPQGIRQDFSQYEVSTVTEAGFKGLKDRDLLTQAAGKFDVLITVDQNIEYQQNLKDSKIAILVLVARRNTIKALKPLVPQALLALENLKKGEIVRIETS